jgi:molecular chaperone GrpE
VAPVVDAEEVVDAEVVEEDPGTRPEPVDAAGSGQAGGAADSVEQDLASLIEEARSQRDEYLNLAQRTKADFENFRKRMAAESAAARVRGRIDVIGGVIEAIDNLERVMAAERIDPDDARQGELQTDLPVSVQGVIVAYRDLHAALEAAGAEAFDPAGRPFDPNLHEALQAIPAEGVESGVVVEVMQRGYRADDQVIRPARVVVSQ